MCTKVNLQVHVHTFIHIRFSYTLELKHRKDELSFAMIITCRSYTHSSHARPSKEWLLQLVSINHTRNSSRTAKTLAYRVSVMPCSCVTLEARSSVAVLAVKGPAKEITVGQDIINREPPTAYYHQLWGRVYPGGSSTTQFKCSTSAWSGVHLV